MACGFASDFIAGRCSAKWREIVADVERAFAFGAKRLRSVGGECCVATRAFQMFYFWHEMKIADAGIFPVQ